MARTKVIIMKAGDNDPKSVEIIFTSLTAIQLMDVIKQIENQSKEGGK